MNTANQSNSTFGSGACNSMTWGGPRKRGDSGLVQISPTKPLPLPPQASNI